MLHTDPNTPIYGLYTTKDRPKTNVHWTELTCLPEITSLQYRDTIQGFSNGQVRVIIETPTGSLTITDYEVTIL